MARGPGPGSRTGSRSCSRCTSRAATSPTSSAPRPGARGRRSPISSPRCAGRRPSASATSSPTRWTISPTRERPTGCGPCCRRPADARELFARQLELAWERLLARHWGRLLTLLEADIQHRSAVLARRGLRGALAGLHPAVRATSDSVRLAHGDDERDLAGEGLLLMPSAFVWPDPVMVLDPPWQPSLIYPVRGVADLWRNRPRPCRARWDACWARRAPRILAVLDEPASTTALVRRLELSPANVSAHLGVLRDAGLVVSGRRGREVQYRAASSVTQSSLQIARIDVLTETSPAARLTHTLPGNRVRRQSTGETRCPRRAREPCALRAGGSVGSSAHSHCLPPA